MSTICFEIVYASPAGPKPGQTGLKPGFFGHFPGFFGHFPGFFGHFPGFFGHFPGFFGSIPGRKCYNIVIFLAQIFLSILPDPPKKQGPPLPGQAQLWRSWLYCGSGFCGFSPIPAGGSSAPNPARVWSPWPNSASGFCALSPAAAGLTAPLLAILVIFRQPIPGGFANPGRWLQRPRPRPGLVTLAKPSHRLLCAFSSRGRPRRPTFGYFSYILAANPRAPRSNRPPSSQWCRCPARCPCGGPASPPGRCAPFSGSPRPQWSAAAR